MVHSWSVSLTKQYNALSLDVWKNQFGSNKTMERAGGEGDHSSYVELMLCWNVTRQMVGHCSERLVTDLYALSLNHGNG